MIGESWENRNHVKKKAEYLKKGKDRQRRLAKTEN